MMDYRKLSEEGIEVWLPVPGYVGKYEVSNMGRVKILARVNERGRFKERILEPHMKNSGYVAVAQVDNYQTSSRTVHLIVMEAFMPGSGNMVVRHINGDKRDNRLCNLEWVRRTNNGVKGSARNRRLGLVDKRGKTLREFSSLAAASMATGLSRQSIWNVCKGVTMSCRGLTFKYLD